MRHGAFLPNQLFIHFATLLALAQKVKRAHFFLLFYLLYLKFYLFLLFTYFTEEKLPRSQTIQVFSFLFSFSLSFPFSYPFISQFFFLSLFHSQIVLVLPHFAIFFAIPPPSLSLSEKPNLYYYFQEHLTCPFLPSLLACFLPSWQHWWEVIKPHTRPFLPCFLPSFLPSLLPSFLAALVGTNQASHYGGGLSTHKQVSVTSTRIGHMFFSQVSKSTHFLIRSLI